MQAVLPAGDSVDVTILRGGDAHVSGLIEAHQGNYLRLRLDRAVPAGTPIKIEWGRAMILAEVTGCGYNGDHFSASLEIEHALFDTEEVARLARRLLDGPF